MPTRPHSRALGAPQPVSVNYTSVFAFWAALALAISLSGALADVPRPAIPFVILSGPGLAFIAYRRSVSFREWARTLSLRVLLGLHVVRAPIGAMFLAQSAQGILHPTFAKLAGPGDMIAGALALVALRLLPADSPGRRRALLVINGIGLVDMVLVIATAQRILLFTNEFEQLALIREFPFSLIPLLLVPWILISHGLVFARLRRS